MTSQTSERSDLWFLNVCHDTIADVLVDMKAINKGPLRGRKLALAITNIEQGQMWLERALVSIAKHLPESEED